MGTFLRWLGDILSTQEGIRNFSLAFIILYYVVSALYIWADEKRVQHYLLKKHGPVDIITSIAWVLFAVILIWSLAEHASQESLTLWQLIEFYAFFLFLFAFIYGILDWHFPEKLIDGISNNKIEAEFQYLSMSVGTQTLFGYWRAKPKHWVIEVFAAIQALLSLWFVATIIARSVNLLAG
ncbi:MAG: hypothetical protein ACK4FJ_04175 [Ferrovibrio sp.]|uniref:hypothetical protein n=1 Tax=Ferrovibrio sp. TaxID=1917215 RepID=UPI00391C419C